MNKGHLQKGAKAKNALYGVNFLVIYNISLTPQAQQWKQMCTEWS